MNNALLGTILSTLPSQKGSFEYNGGMPIFGRYLLKNYLKVLLLSVLSFITILLVSRLEEIAEFASMGAKPSYLALFTLYQIPYILPIAIPVSCLISTMVLFQRLSHTHELTALRAAGISIRKIIAPILIAGTFLAFGTFYISSELATASHMATRKMAYDLTSINPLLLLQSAKIASLRGAYVQMNPIRNGEAANDLIIAFNSGHLNLCLAKKIEMGNNNLQAEQVSLISSTPGENTLNHLLIENQRSMTSSATEFAHFLRKQGWKIANDHLKFSLLRLRYQTLRSEIGAIENQAKLAKNLQKCRSEIVRRFSMGLATLTFTLMGMAFGIEISRHHKKRGVISVLILAAAALIAFFVAKDLDHLFWLASILFLLPHLLIVLVSMWTLRRINRGIE